MAGFVFDFAEQKKAAEAAKNGSSGGGGRKILDLKKEITEVLILPPTIKDAPIFFETNMHEVWANKKPIAKCASPTFVGEDDPIMKAGWKIKDKFADSKNDKLKNLWRLFMPKKAHYVYVLNKEALDSGPLLLKLPHVAYELLLDELKDAESDDDIKAICDLDEGRWLRIKHNGATGLAKEYIAKFSKNPVKLSENGAVDADKLVSNVPDLRKLQPAQDPAAIKRTLSAINQQVAAILTREGTSMDDEDEDSFEVDSDEEIEIEETKSSKKSKATSSTSKKATKVVDEDDYDLDEDED
jgi:hypothetical protein